MKIQEKTEALPESGIKTVAIHHIVANPYQPRNQFEQKNLQELADSIVKVGLIQPPTVRPIKGTKRYELIAGERRLRACQIAGLSEIPVYIKEHSDRLSAQAALIENIQRKDLNPLEIAQALQNLIESQSLSQQKLAEHIGKQRSTVANYLRLLSLPPSILKSLQEETISMGHAKAILSLESPEKQERLHNTILRKQLTVREAESQARQLSTKARERSISSKKKSNNADLDLLEELFQKKLGSKTRITNTAQEKGKLIIEYSNWNDLERIMNILGITND